MRHWLRFSVLCLALGAVASSDLSDPQFLARLIPSASSVTPNSFSGIAIWWKADSYSVTNNAPLGGTGYEWIDQTGHGFDAYNPTAEFQPVFKTSVFGSMPAVALNLSGSGLQNFVFTNLVLGVNQDYTVVGVMKMLNLDSLLLGNTTSNFQIRNRASAATSQISSYAGASDAVSAIYSSSGSSPTGPTNAHMYIWRRTGDDSSQFRFDNTAITGTLTNGTGQTITWNRIGYVSYVQTFYGYLGEVIVYTNFLSNTDCDSLYNNYLKPRWGLP